jgi:hypothetical protein
MRYKNWCGRSAQLPRAFHETLSNYFQKARWFCCHFQCGCWVHRAPAVSGFIFRWRTSFSNMHITKFNQLMERTRALKKSLFETIDAEKITASVDPSLASRISAARAKIGAIGAATATQPAATGLPPGARTTQELLAELNSIDDPGEQTVFWREHYAELKRAQWREVYACAQTRAQGEERFLNITIAKQNK